MLTNQLQPMVKINNLSKNLAGMCSSIMTHMSSQKEWIIDLGASKHIFSNPNLFSHLGNAINTNAIFSNRSKLNINYLSDIQLNKDFTLHNVLYLPDFDFNHFPIRNFLNDYKDCTTYFSQDKFIIQKK